MSTGRIEPAVAVLGGKIYVVGGHTGISPRSSTLNSVERFDPITNAWESLSPMSTARRGAAAAVLDGKLYVAGGCGPDTKFGADSDLNCLSTVERYDPSTNAWESVASMSKGRWQLALCGFP